MSRWNPAADFEQANRLLFSVELPDFLLQVSTKAAQEIQELQSLQISLQILQNVFE